MPPLAASAHQVEQPVQQMSYVGRARAASGLGGWDKRLQQAELIITQSLARPIAPDQRAIFRRPHGDLQAGNLLERRKLGPGRSVTSASPIFQNGVLGLIREHLNRVACSRPVSGFPLLEEFVTPFR